MLSKDVKMLKKMIKDGIIEGIMGIIPLARFSRKGGIGLTDKEFKQLSRAQLIDIIYQLQLKIDELVEQKDELEKALEDKRFRINNAGNIAEAALEINNCFCSAQNAAEHYLNEIRAMREETQAECEQLIVAARAKADAIIESAKNHRANYDSVIDAIMEEYEQNHSNNG